VVPTVEKAIGQKLAPMGFDKTIYAPASIVALIVSPLLCAILCYLMHPSPEKTKPISEEALKGLTAVADFERQISRGTDIADN
jgi:short subunit fatty acids transporter